MAYVNIEIGSMKYDLGMLDKEELIELGRGICSAMETIRDYVPIPYVDKSMIRKAERDALETLRDSECDHAGDKNGEVSYDQITKFMEENYPEVTE